MIISNSISLILYTDNHVLYQTNCGMQIVPHFYLIFLAKKNDYNFRTKGHNPDCVFKTMSLPCDISIRFKLVSTGIWSVITL